MYQVNTIYVTKMHMNFGWLTFHCHIDCCLKAAESRETNYKLISWTYRHELLKDLTKFQEWPLNSGFHKHFQRFCKHWVCQNVSWLQCASAWECKCTSTTTGYTSRRKVLQETQWFHGHLRRFECCKFSLHMQHLMELNLGVPNLKF